MGCQKYVDRVVVVDDGSSDATADRAASAGAHIVRHEWNAGYGAALRTCFETAREIWCRQNGDHRRRRPALAYYNVSSNCDPDGSQRDPEEIPQLLQPLDRGVDLVIGSRFCKGNGKDILAYRKVGMRILDITTNFLGGLCVTDTQSGFRAYGKRAIDCI